jgi:ribosomal protein S18 acetylase RimI-like enzyme
MLTTRRAQATDLAAVQSITDAAYDAYVQTLGGKPLPMLEDYAPHIAAGETWLIARDGVDVALAVFEPAPDHLMIFSLAVLPGAQGGGLGQALLRLADDRARALGVNEVRLYTNSLMQRNIALYRRAGFIETGRRPNTRRPGWFFVDMARPVRS